MSTRAGEREDVAATRLSPVSLVLIGIMSVQFGAAVSKGLFTEIPPTGMVLLRLAATSLILLAVARPRLSGRTAADWRPVLALGLALGAMNWAFYESFARIPLGAAVTIEFVGPLAVAARRSSTIPVGGISVNSPFEIAAPNCTDSMPMSTSHTGDNRTAGTGSAYTGRPEPPGGESRHRGAGMLTTRMMAPATPRMQTSATRARTCTPRESSARLTA